MVIPSPPGFGTPIASEQIGGAHYQRVQLSTSGDGSPVSDDNPLPIRADHETAYGEIFVANANPIIQASPTYNLIPANWRTITATGGSAAASNKEFICQTGTSVGGYGVIRSLRSCNYHAGVAAIGHFECRFTAGVANSLQGVGFFNVGDGYLFGYSGTEFGVIHQYGGKPEIRTITVSVGAGGSETLTLTLNTVDYTIPLTAGTTAHNSYEIAEWLNANQSVWAASQNDSVVIIMANSDGAKSGTYTYSSSGTGAGSIAQTTAGVTKTTDFYPQDEWNVNTLSTWDTPLDPTKGNGFSIQYHSIRYGVAEFFVMDSISGRRIPVHRINKGNTGTSVMINNPSMRIGCFAASLGSTTNLTVAAGTMSAFQAGIAKPIRNPRGISTTKSIGTTQVNVLTIRCKQVYGGEPNQVEMEPIKLSCFTEQAKGATVYVYTGGTLDEYNFTDLGSNLVSEYDTTSTTITGGTPIDSFVIAANDSKVIPLNDYMMRIPPGITLTIAMKINTGGATALCGASISWYEDV